MGLRVFVLNLNNLDYTKQCIDDLLSQDTLDFKITLIDQGSTEAGTSGFLHSLPVEVDIELNAKNEPVNKVWNWCHENHSEELLCFLNNDVRIPNNFISDTIKVFEKEEKVGIVAHATNHPSYKHVLPTLNYAVVPKYVNMQGWDYTIRRECFTKIPSELKIYCGDDFLYHHMYEMGYNMAYVLSSPMIHYEGQSKKFMTTSGIEDIYKFKSLGFKHYLKINLAYSKIKPTFSKIIE